MKIAYLFYFSAKSLPLGVINKIKGQANAAQKLNIDMDFIVINRVKQEENGKIKFIKLQLPSNKILNFIKRRYFKFLLIFKAIDLSNYDRIILRYPLSTDLFLYKKFWSKYKGKVITIHNSNEIYELKNERNLEGRIKLFLEKRKAPKVLSNIIGLIGVSEEIRLNELKKINKRIPSLVIPNGADVESIPFTKFKPFDNKTLKMIFVSSTFSPWHGLDRLLESLFHYKSSVNIELFLIGRIVNPIEKEALKKLSLSNVKIHLLGNLYGRDMDSYFSEATIAIGSLALYRNKMNETSTLKIAEYTARGIPFIYAYDDPNIEGKENFALKFKNNPSLIDVHEIIQFAKKVSVLENISLEMRDYALKNIDWKVKIRQFYNFASNIK